MRWLNDNNKLSVPDQKYILVPEKSVYKPEDGGYACFPGFPGRSKFRILAVGGKVKAGGEADSMTFDINQFI